MRKERNSVRRSEFPLGRPSRLAAGDRVWIRGRWKWPTAILLAAVLCPVLGHAGDAVKRTLIVKVAQFKNENGQVLVHVFEGSTGFPTDPEKAEWSKRVSIAEAKAGVPVPIPDGEFAISVIHDEDGNGKLKTNILGIPREGTGVSRDAKGKMGPPRYSDAKLVGAEAPKEITITLWNPGS